MVRKDQITKKKKIPTRGIRSKNRNNYTEKPPKHELLRKNCVDMFLSGDAKKNQRYLFIIFSDIS